MKDTDLMPWGKYEGEEMQEIPAKYLLWLYENNKCDDRVRGYIKDNLQVLRQEADLEDIHADSNDYRDRYDH